MLLKVVENVVQVSNILDPDETPSYSASHPDPDCLHCDTAVVLGRLRVNRFVTDCQIIKSTSYTSLSVEFGFIIKHRLAVLKAYLLNNLK